MKTVTLNLTQTITELFTVAITDDDYTALLTMAADGASDEEISDYLVANVPDSDPIENSAKEVSNVVFLVRDDEGKSTVLCNVTEGEDA